MMLCAVKDSKSGKLESGKLPMIIHLFTKLSLCGNCYQLFHVWDNFLTQQQWLLVIISFSLILKGKLKRKRYDDVETTEHIATVQLSYRGAPAMSGTEEQVYAC
jgi:hypothetical protein